MKNKSEELIYMSTHHVLAKNISAPLFVTKMSAPNADKKYAGSQTISNHYVSPMVTKNMSTYGVSQGFVSLSVCIECVSAEGKQTICQTPCLKKFQPQY